MQSSGVLSLDHGIARTLGICSPGVHYCAVIRARVGASGPSTCMCALRLQDKPLVWPIIAYASLPAAPIGYRSQVIWPIIDAIPHYGPSANGTLGNHAIIARQSVHFRFRPIIGTVYDSRCLDVDDRSVRRQMTFVRWFSGHAQWLRRLWPSILDDLALPSTGLFYRDQSMHTDCP